ncbi:MAG TPA: hypothetical protein PKE21_13830 [Flavobacteriales bacterium]|nr:hypothetical protein [Flavobacteriales bacterium]HMR28557.1 hypothetical protein [Flavobacteriales bacterium]
MALLKKNRRGLKGEEVFALLLVLFVAAMVVLMQGGCKQPQPTVIVMTDSTHSTVEVHRRDTVVMVPGDQAQLDVSTDLAQLRRLIEEVRRRPHVVRGRNNAKLSVSLRDDSLRIAATCDSMELVLNDAITTINRRDQRIQVLEDVLEKKRNDDAMPGWAKGLSLVLACLAVLVVLVALLRKRLTKPL